MSIPKKGSRKIVVDNVVYGWRIRWKPTYTQQCLGNSNLIAAVELYENPTNVLSVTFPWARYDSCIKVAEQPVTPKHIEQSIRKALKAGWQPNENGHFKIDYD
jgi:hypothetical protein